MAVNSWYNIKLLILDYLIMLSWRGRQFSHCIFFPCKSTVKEKVKVVLECAKWWEFFFHQIFWYVYFISSVPLMIKHTEIFCIILPTPTGTVSHNESYFVLFVLSVLAISPNLKMKSQVYTTGCAAPISDSKQ